MYEQMQADWPGRGRAQCRASGRCCCPALPWLGRAVGQAAGGESGEPPLLARGGLGDSAAATTTTTYYYCYYYYYY